MCKNVGMKKIITFIAYHLIMGFILKFSIQSGFDHNIGMLSAVGFSVFVNILTVMFKNANNS